MKNLSQSENEPIALTTEETGIEDTGTRLSWYRCPIDRGLLAQLNKKNDWRPLLHNLAQLGFSAVTGAFAFWAFHNLAWPWVVGAAFFHCSFYGFFGGGTGGHELSHKNMFKTKWLNELFIRINGFLTWFNFIHFRHSHAKHHQYTTHHDLDGEVMLPLNLRWYHWIYGLTLSVQGLTAVFPMLFRHAFGRRRDVVLKSEWEQRIFPTSEPREVGKLVNWSRFLLGGHAALALIFILSGNWILLLLVTFAPFIATWFVILTHMPQHIGMEPDVADWRRSTRTYLAGPIVSFFYWNMNYHVEHHMYAAVPFYNLPKLRKALEADLPVAPKGLIATWLEIIDTLRKQKKDPTYYRPLEFPTITKGHE
jgi:fatty acid desaturase